jgi:hypothetical protein
VAIVRDLLPILVERVLVVGRFRRVIPEDAVSMLVIDGNEDVRLELHLATGGYARYRVLLATPEGVESGVGIV